jgi:dihydrofolate reductase
MKLTYYVATSSDGFIARENGDVSWLDDLNIDMTDTGYDDFFASIDGLVMGRNTYDFVFNYGSWPYGDKPSWVCTSNELEILEGANLRISKLPNDVIKEAKSNGLKHLWLVGGGKLASAFLEKGLLTHLSISEMPVKLKSGIPLFAGHNLENISARKTEIFQKKGFKQVEIALEIINCLP